MILLVVVVAVAYKHQDRTIATQMELISKLGYNNNQFDRNKNPYFNF